MSQARLELWSEDGPTESINLIAVCGMVPYLLGIEAPPRPWNGMDREEELREIVVTTTEFAICRVVEAAPDVPIQGAEDPLHKYRQDRGGPDHEQATLTGGESGA